MDGYRPAPPSQRSTTFAVAAFVFLLIFGAGFHDVLGKLGQFLNLGMLAGVTWVFAHLGIALEPSLWRGVPTDALVQRAESIKMADIARTLVQDLAPTPSAITTWGAKAAWIAGGFYVLALLGLWHAIGRLIGRNAMAYRFVSPAFAMFLVCAGGPLIVGLVLSLWRFTPSTRTFVALDNYKAFVADGPSSPRPRSGTRSPARLPGSLRARCCNCCPASSWRSSWRRCEVAGAASIARSS